MAEKFMKKIFFTLIIFSFIFLSGLLSPVDAQINQGEEIFEAKVLEVVKQEEITRGEGSKKIQQDLVLRGLTGSWEGQTFNFYGISEIDVIGSNIYEKGDKVLVQYSKDVDGNDAFYVIDYVRRGKLYFLAFIFSLIIILVGRLKGVRALLSLVISFLVIMKLIVPRILAGGNPLFISIIGSFLILIFIVYLTEGINRKSHLAIASIFFSLLITYVLSIIFISVTKITGMAQEETMYLIGVGGGMIDFKGLLLAGILIGTLGVLDDVIISQIETVEQIRNANPTLTGGEIFKMAFSVGNAHLGAVINTLFLAYAGASLPLLLLFSIKEPPFLSFSQIINNEMIATEIIRTLVGSSGLVLAMPMATILAVYFGGIKEKTESK